MLDARNALAGALIAGGVGVAIAAASDSLSDSSGIFALAAGLVALGVLMFLLGRGEPRQETSTPVHASSQAGTVRDASPSPGDSAYISELERVDPAMAEIVREVKALRTKHPGTTDQPADVTVDRDAYEELYREEPTGRLPWAPKAHGSALKELPAGDFVVWSPSVPAGSIDEEESPEVLRLEIGPGYVAGRAQVADVKFDGDFPGVSRRHALLMLREPGVLIVADLGSRFGTSIDGHDLRAFMREQNTMGAIIRDKAEILLGEAGVLTYAHQSPEETSSPKQGTSPSD